MEDWEKKVLDEREDLTEKILKLLSFIESDESSKLNKEQQKLLKIQYQIMCDYRDILSERILFI